MRRTSIQIVLLPEVYHMRLHMSTKTLQFQSGSAMITPDMHHRKELLMRPVKKVEDSRTQQQYLICPAHINHYGRLFGGQLLKWIDELAGIVAIRHCGATVTTAAIDNLQFQAPAYSGDMIVLEGWVTYVGRSSMEVRVDTYREALDGAREMINRAYIDMVAISSTGEPIEVPGLSAETEEERQEQEAAKKRREMRRQRRQEGF